MTSQPSQQLLNSLTFCVIDLETTGGNHQYDEIIEIGMVRVQQQKITQELNYLINPNIPIPNFIQKLTSITQKQVSTAPSIDDVLDEIIEFIGDSILVAHNTSFDIPFLNSVLQRKNRPILKNKVICTNVMTKYLIPEIMSSNLNYMSQVFHIKHAKAHRAIEDAKATAQLLQKYLGFFEHKKIRKVNQLYYPRNRFEIDRTHFDSTITWEAFESKLASIKTPLLMTLKGEQGIIVACVPMLSGTESKGVSFVKNLFHTAEWKIATIKMQAPFLRCLLDMSIHLPKMPKQVSNDLLDYLAELFPPQGDPSVIMQDYDILVFNHLIEDQYVLFPMANINVNNYLTFKYPSHKKKFFQNIISLKNRFEKHLRKKRRVHLEPPLKPILASYLRLSDDYLHLKFEDIHRKNEGKIFSLLENFRKQRPNRFNFPLDHL